jgi:hypothetical protein
MTVGTRDLVLPSNAGGSGEAASLPSQLKGGYCLLGVDTGSPGAANVPSRRGFTPGLSAG